MRRGGRQGRVLGMAAAVVALGWVPAAASANWIEPIVIESGDVRMVGPANGHGHPHAATGPDGVTTLVWGRPGPPLVSGAPTRTIAMVRVDPAGGRGPEVAVSPIVEEGYDPRVVLGPGGAGVVMWHRVDGFADFRIFLRRLDAAGNLGPQVTVCEGLCYGAEAAVAADGTVLVAWHSGGGTPMVRRLGPDDALGPVVPVPTTGNGSTPFVPLVLAPAPDGGALLAYITQRPGQRVEAVRLAPDGTPGTIHQLSAPGVGEEAALDAPDALVTPDGTGHVVFRLGTRTGPFATDPLEVALRAARIEPDGDLFDVRTLAAVGNDNRPELASPGSPPTIIARPGGGLAVAFLQHGPGEACAIALLPLSPGGEPGAPVVGSTPESCESTQPDFAAGRPDGSTVAVSTAVVLGNTDIGVPLTFRVEASAIGASGALAGREVLSTGFGLNARTSAGGDVVAAYWYTGRAGAGQVAISLFADRFPPRPAPVDPGTTPPPDGGSPPPDPVTPDPAAPGAPAPGAAGRLATPAPTAAFTSARVRGRLLLRVAGRMPAGTRGRPVLLQRRIGRRYVTLARRVVPANRRILVSLVLRPGRAATRPLGVRGITRIRVRVLLPATSTRRAGVGLLIPVRLAGR